MNGGTEDSLNFLSYQTRKPIITLSFIITEELLGKMFNKAFDEVNIGLLEEPIRECPCISHLLYGPLNNFSQRI